jgi:uncharacterized membrane protein
VSTNRLESFSDGVFAVAITLLVLGIAVPSVHEPGSLAHKLGHNWTQYAAYVVSFMTIGIIWINHHGMVSRLRGVDHTILILNLILLMTVAILPFATNVIAAYLRVPHDRDVAAAVYSGAFLVMGAVFALENGVILLRRENLLAVTLPLDRRRQILRRAAGGVSPYAVAVAVAFVSAYASLAICAAIGLFYALPLASGYESGND